VEEEELAVELERWQIDENWKYGPQAIWGDIVIGLETDRQGSQITKYYISKYDLRSWEKERVLELPSDRIVYDAPAIHGDRVVWASVDRQEAERQRSVRHSPMPNSDVFLLDIKTGEVRQLTTDDRAQIYPRIYGDTVVWLDNRHEEGYHNPTHYDVYAYDLRSNKESRITSTTSAEDRNLSISGNLVSWTDNRHADPEVNIHAGNEPDYNNEIYVYDLTTNKERRITNYAGNDHYSAIDGSRIVWLRQFTLMEAEVFLHDLDSEQETQVSHDRYAAYSPAIYQDRIVWADARVSKGNTSGDVIMNGQSGAADIYLYDLGTERETLLISSETEGEYSGTVFRQVWLNPVIHGDFVVYTLERQIGSIIYAMSLTKK